MHQSFRSLRRITDRSSPAKSSRRRPIWFVPFLERLELRTVPAVDLMLHKSEIDNPTSAGFNKDVEDPPDTNGAVGNCSYIETDIVFGATTPGFVICIWRGIGLTRASTPAVSRRPRSRLFRLPARSAAIPRKSLANRIEANLPTLSALANLPGR
jgi:hypothetical protein